MEIGSRRQLAQMVSKSNWLYFASNEDKTVAVVIAVYSCKKILGLPRDNLTDGLNHKCHSPVPTEL